MRSVSYSYGLRHYSRYSLPDQQFEVFSKGTRGVEEIRSEYGVQQS